MRRHKFRNLKHEFAQESAEARENEDDNTTKMLVSFYDTRYNHTQYGQFIGRYYASTLLGLDGYGRGIKDRGLNLHGGVDDWFINADNANHVVDFIEGKI